MLLPHITTSQEFSHVNMTFPKCKIQITDADKKKFYLEYSRLVHNGYVDFGLGESSKSPLMQVVVDIDIKKPHSGGPIERIYEEIDIKRVVEGYQNAIMDVFEDVEDEELTCVVMEKDPYFESTLLDFLVIL